MHIHTFFRPAILTSKVGQTNLAVVFDQGSLVGMCKIISLYVHVCSMYDLCHTTEHRQTALVELKILHSRITVYQTTPTLHFYVFSVQARDIIIP